MELGRPGLVEQPRIAVGQAEAPRVWLDLGPAEKVCHSRVDAIARDLGRKRKVEATGAAAGDELIGRRQRGFGFARSHLGFDHIKARLPHLLQRGGLQRTGWSAGRKESGELAAGLEPGACQPWPQRRLSDGAGLYTLTTEWREMALVRANPVCHGNQAGHEPKHGVAFRRMLRQRLKLDRQFVHQAATRLLPDLAAHSADFEPAKRPLVGLSVMRAHHCRPAMQLRAAEKLLERPLADKGVIRLAVCPILLRGYIAQVELHQPRRAFHQEPRRDFPHIMRRHQSDHAGRQQFLKRSRKNLDQRLRHAADVQTVVSHADAGPAISRRLAQKWMLSPITFRINQSGVFPWFPYLHVERTLRFAAWQVKPINVNGPFRRT